MSSRKAETPPVTPPPASSEFSKSLSVPKFGAGELNPVRKMYDLVNENDVVLVGDSDEDENRFKGRVEIVLLDSETQVIDDDSQTITDCDCDTEMEEAEKEEEAKTIPLAMEAPEEMDEQTHRGLRGFGLDSQGRDGLGPAPLSRWGFEYFGLDSQGKATYDAAWAAWKAHKAN